MITFNISSLSAFDVFGLLLTIVGVILTVTSAIAGLRLSKDITEVKAILAILQSGILQQFLKQHQSMWTEFVGQVADDGQTISINDRSMPTDAEFQPQRSAPRRRFWRSPFRRNPPPQLPGDQTIGG